MTIIPRPYQKEAVEAVLQAKDSGITRQMISLPTGSGKTVVFSLLTKALKTKTLVLAHREELLEQAWNKMQMVYPEAHLGLVRGSRNETWGDVVITSVQTAVQPRRMAMLRKAGFKTMVIDEAHHASASSYKKVIKGLGFASDDPEKLLVGVTATAFRGDGKALGEVFQQITYERTIMAMIRGGYLCDAVGKSVSTQVDLSGVHTSCGDFQVNELSFKINVPERNKLVADTYLEYCKDKKAVIFCADVQHAKDMADVFLKRGVTASPMWGAMPKDERKRTLRLFAGGQCQVLTNCAVLTEGFDDPAISAVFLARPTKSKSLYVQMVGRGLRTYPGKSNCLVVDFGDNTGRHKLCGLATLAGDPKIRKIQDGESLSKAKETPLPTDEGDGSDIKITGHDTKTVELFERSKFVWVQAKEHFSLSLGGANKVWLKNVGPEQYEVLVYAGQMYVESLSGEPIPLGYAQGVAEDYVRLKGASVASKSARWRSAPATDKQKKALLKMGIAIPEGMTAGHASDLIDKKMAISNVAAIEEATAKQIRYMKWKHITIPSGCTKAQAKALIARAVKKGAA